MFALRLSLPFPVSGLSSEPPATAESATASETAALALPLVFSLTLTVLRTLLAEDFDELLGRECLGELGIVLLLHFQLRDS